jgi:hypothetical protein
MRSGTRRYRIVGLIGLTVSILCGIGLLLAAYPIMPVRSMDATGRFERLACRVGECVFVAERLTGSDPWYQHTQQQLQAQGWTATGRHPGVPDAAPDRYTRVKILLGVAFWEQLTVANEPAHARITVRRWISGPW